MPIFGSTDKEDKEDEQLDQTICSSPEEEEEKGILKACVHQIKYLNGLLHYIGGRIGQFLQG